MRWDNTEDYYLPMEEETYTLHISLNPEFDSTQLRYVFNSLTTPISVIEFDMLSQQKTILKTQEVLGDDFDSSHYRSQRLWADARDGSKIPISIVYGPKIPYHHIAYTMSMHLPSKIKGRPSF